MKTQTIGSPNPAIQYAARTAVRCLITSNKTQICIIHVKKGNYYKLPGGGVEPEDPDHATAARREALEETGCKVDIKPNAIAHTVEYRGTLKQESYAYICKVVKDTGRVELTELEKAEGLKHEWCGVEEAARKMREVEPTSEVGRFIWERDGFILQRFMEL